MLVYLSLGANLGDREAAIERALAMIQEKAGTLLRRSAFFYSEPWGFRSEHGFCNLCVAIDTALSPMELLRTTQAIERALGRTHKSHNGQYHDRTIDIDLLEYYDEKKNPVAIQSPELTLPHPLMHERDFVLIPLREIQGAQGVPEQ